ncbi:calcium/calmodulin-regulated receptor-like kinase 2 [Nymphaea colorata]|nr:calcium/calmodulin-regulated receptor-like kinase 2 [Nymphaea colorata]XP_031480625.1 calcium/calmodulin-regulated receptor-like kinase 2 [Nymphaea colorata]
MANQFNLIVGLCVGLAIGLLAAICAFIIIRLYRKRSQLGHQTSESGASLPVHANGIDSSLVSSIAESSFELPSKAMHSHWPWQGNHDKKLLFSGSGIPSYPYKDIQKATQNFTTILGQGSFGPVYKAVMSTGQVVAVKVLASNSRQGEKEFHTEVVLLSRLHHRNLVNLVGYCVEKGQHMLIYEFMSNGSLASCLYDEGPCNLGWDDRLQIALDVSHGIEYLHEGAVPPVVHRDLKSANILLDQSMRAKVADFGLSKEEAFNPRLSGLKGTYGYMDPEYMSTNKFTKKSDIYSFGVILFELITAINPQQGLMDYINLAAMTDDGNAGWDEILDKQLVGKCDLNEVRILASIAQKCIHKSPRKRPSIVDISRVLSMLKQRHLSKNESISLARGDFSHVIKRIESQQIQLSNLTSGKEKVRDSNNT